MGVALASAQHHRREGLVAVAPVMQQSRGDALQVRADGTHHVAAQRHRPGLIVAIEQTAPQRRKALPPHAAVGEGAWLNSHGTLFPPSFPNGAPTNPALFSP